MSAELLINVTPFETRIARVENGRAEEIYIERERERGLRSNIYKGRINRIIPGIQAAFVDIGLPKAGFLYAGDIHYEPHEESEEISNGEELGQLQSRRDHPPINQMIREGQDIIVQVTKDPIASKGPRLSSLISLAGRYLVYLPHSEQVGIARRIEDEAERDRLRDIAESLKPDKGGLIVRTVAEGHDVFELKRDLDFLLRLWGDIEQRLKQCASASLAHMELNLYLRVMRDFVDDDVEKIHIDSREAYERMKNFAKRFMPDVSNRLYYYPGKRPIFDVYGVENEINRSLQRSVSLKSGGSIVIDQTEALIAIDVNSGSFVSSYSMEETSFKTNLEAVNEIAHQLRIRNLGGIIVVDFIDMREEENRTRLVEALETALKRDKSKTNIAHLSSLGLIEMTRKRTRESLGRTLLDSCPKCHGAGQSKSMTTLCYQLFREVVAESRAYSCEKMMVIANPEMIDLLLGEESEQISKLEEFTATRITLKSDAQLPPEQYEVVLL